jgi:hypothetical protein
MSIKPTPLPEHPWTPGAIWKREWPIVRESPVTSFLCFFIGCALIIFLYNVFIIPGKNATIELWKTKTEVLNGTSPLLPGSAPQVKSEALILANQMFEFAKTYKRGFEPDFEEDYHHNFSFRIDTMRNALARLGQTDSNLDLFLGYKLTIGRPFLPEGVDSNIVYQIATAIQTLANKLPNETKSN